MSRTTHHRYQKTNNESQRWQKTIEQGYIEQLNSISHCIQGAAPSTAVLSTHPAGGLLLLGVTRSKETHTVSFQAKSITKNSNKYYLLVETLLLTNHSNGLFLLLFLFRYGCLKDCTSLSNLLNARKQTSSQKPQERGPFLCLRTSIVLARMFKPFASAALASEFCVISSS